MPGRDRPSKKNTRQQQSKAVFHYSDHFKMAAVTSAASAAAARIGAALSDAQYFESSMVRVEDIRRQLDSRSVKDKLDAMKRVIALISLGKDASTFFPDVVKNVVAPSLEVKKLVYLYLVHYAEEKQDLALLAINSFQKDLSDHNQHIRALSLRVLSSIRVKVILQVVILAISKAAKDSSSYVRKAAAHAIGKVCALESSSKEMLMEPLQDLVSDRSTQVMGSAIAAFEEVCPHNFSIIHPHYRRICSSLADVDPWGQITIVNMLLRYARVHFCDPYKATPAANGGVAYPSRNHAERRNPDLSLLLRSVAPLFYSLNNSVVSSAIAVFYHLATKEEFSANAIRPLMRLVGIRDDGGQAVGLRISSEVAMRHPSLLIPHVSEFYVSAAHSAPLRALRMNVLSKICASAGQEGGIGSKPHIRRALLAELKDYLFRRDKELAAASARAIGCLATAHPGSTPAIVKVLSSVVSTASNPSVVTESIAVLRRLLQRHPTAQTKALPQLIAMLLASDESENETIQEPAARASIIWLLGEFYEKVDAVAMEALRLLARGFVSEAAEVKLQILNLAAKVVAWSQEGKGENASNKDLVPDLQHGIGCKLLEYIVSCAKYDQDYDVRDKARMFHFLFLSTPKQSVFKSSCKAFISKKPIPASVDVKFSSSSPVSDILPDDVIVGSLPHVLPGRRLAGFRRLEEWAEVDTPASIRDEVLGGGSGSAVTREYTGVSSANFHSHMSTAHIGNSVWEPPSGISSSTLNGNGGASSAGGPGVGLPSSAQAQESLTSASLANVDPDRFYDSSGDNDEDESEESSEYESSSAEEGIEPQSIDESKGIASDTRPTTTSALDVLVSTGGIKMNQTAPSHTHKPPSEYDLDAILGGLSATSVSSENKSPVSSANVSGPNRSPWTRVIESWKSGGIEIDAAFLRSPSAAGPEVTPVALRVTNRGEEVASNITFSSRSGDCFSSAMTISALQPSGEEEVISDVRFRGKTGSVRFSVDINGQTAGTGELKPSLGFVIRPYPGITPGEFAKQEKALRGMFGSESSVPLSHPKRNDWMGLAHSVKDQLLHAAFISHVKTSVGSQGVDSSERFSILFAGFLPAAHVASRDKKLILVRMTVVSVKDDIPCACKVWVGSEDILFSANLLQVCKIAVQSIDMPL